MLIAILRSPIVGKVIKLLLTLPAQEAQQGLCANDRASVRLSVRPSVRPSVCLSVCPIIAPQRRAAGLLLSAERAGDIDRQLRATGASSNGATARRSAADAGSVTLTAEVRG